MMLELSGAAGVCAQRLVEALPADAAPVVARLDGALDIVVYRCAQVRGNLYGALRTELTGGVQIIVQLPATRAEEQGMLEARLRPGWTRAQLERRLMTVIERARDEQELRLAREAVQDHLWRLRLRGEYALADAGLPDDPADMTLKEAASALAVLARLV